MEKKNILIIGAGSIGNHFANAGRSFDYNVYVMDKYPVALSRMRNKIYPQRYKKWDKNIFLLRFKKKELLQLPIIDLVIIGTPPATHFSVYKNLNKFLQFKKILFEKPLCTFLQNEKKFKFKSRKIDFFCGYNHSISKSFLFFESCLKKIKNIKLVDIKWNEKWDGILKAHFWLKNEYESYLGNYKKGGGALQEHSHGLHIAVCLAKKFDNLKNFRVQSHTLMKNNKGKNYDYSNNIFLKSKKININLEINLLENPAVKKLKIYHYDGFIEWIVNFKKDYDAVIKSNGKEKKIFKLFKKSRSGEFANEIQHILNIKNEKKYNLSNIKLQNAVDTMKLIKKILK
jgi:predicted dehydrogenase